MAVNNPWLSSFQRSFQDIKDKLIENIKIKLPEITNFSEGNVFIILISLFSAIAEVIHYYIDNVGRETFFTTARKYSSLIKHARLVDYNIKCANPASVDVTLYMADNTTVPVDISIPSGTEFTSKTGVVFKTTKPLIWYANTYSITVPLLQVEYVTDVNFGEIPSEDITVTLNDTGTSLYAEGSMILNVVSDGVVVNWELVDTFAFSTPNSTHYKIELSSGQEPIIVFGNGLQGKKPPVGSILIGSYSLTKGSSGIVAASSLTSVPSIISSISSIIACNNKLAASGGTDYEDFYMLKDHIPLHVRTLGIAISVNDYADITRLMPGVDKAYAINTCGRTVDIYITPDGGGIASSQLLGDTRLKLMSKKVLGTAINLYPAKETLIYISATITGNKSFKSSDIQAQVVNGLVSSYDYNNSDIAKPVRLSEIYAMIEKMPMVDYLTIDNLYLKPTAYSYSDAPELDFDVNITTVSAKSTYLLRYNGTTSSFDILGSNGISTGVSIPYSITDPAWKNITLNNNNWDIRINLSTNGDYENGQIWRIVLLQNNVDQVSSEQAIPLFKSSEQSSLTIIETV